MRLISGLLSGRNFFSFSSLSSAFGNGEMYTMLLAMLVLMHCGNGIQEGLSAHAIQWGPIAAIGMMSRFKNLRSSTAEFINPQSCLMFMRNCLSMQYVKV